MSGREWKPGDVGASRYGVVFYTERGWFFDDGSGPNGPEEKFYPPRDLRPLVVIDPEDREQVERLTSALKLWRLKNIECLADEQEVTDVQAALREFANPTPPKPEEPTGLGAVVEDAEGERWVRKGNSSHGEDWTRQIGDAWTGGSWDRVAAVRVLSEGVTQ